jgi:hypothetical protein
VVERVVMLSEAPEVRLIGECTSDLVRERPAGPQRKSFAGRQRGDELAVQVEPLDGAAVQGVAHDRADAVEDHASGGRGDRGRLAAGLGDAQ